MVQLKTKLTCNICRKKSYVILNNGGLGWKNAVHHLSKWQRSNYAKYCGAMMKECVVRQLLYMQMIVCEEERWIWLISRRYKF